MLCFIIYSGTYQNSDGYTCKFKTCFHLQALLFDVNVFFVVCAVRVIAESDIMQDFLASSEDNIVSFQWSFHVTLS